jgi:hypothetical protein
MVIVKIFFQIFRTVSFCVVLNYVSAKVLREMGGLKKDMDEAIRRNHTSTGLRISETLNKPEANGDILGGGEGDIDDFEIDVGINMALEFPARTLAAKGTATGFDIDVSDNPMVRSPRRHPMANMYNNDGRAAAAVSSLDLEAVVGDDGSSGGGGSFPSESRLRARASIKLG